MDEEEFWSSINCFENLKSSFESLEPSVRKLIKDSRNTNAALVRTRKENKKLAERNKMLEEELQKAKQQDESINKMCTTFAAVKEVCKQQEHAEAASQLSKKRKYDRKVYKINDSVNCPICLEAWSQSGEHNVCSLSCGHFFGRSCIRQWITSSSKCPICSRSATSQDIRDHYVSQTYDGEEKI